MYLQNPVSARNLLGKEPASITQKQNRLPALRAVSVCVFSWQTVYSWRKGPAWIFTLHRSRHLCEAYTLNIWGDLVMLFMQTRSDRFGQNPRQIQKSSLSKPGIIPFLSTKTPSENHLPKHCGFSWFGEYNEVLNLLTLFILLSLNIIFAFRDTKSMEISNEYSLSYLLHCKQDPSAISCFIFCTFHM